MRNLATLAMLVTVLAGCRTRYAVIPAAPNYVLKSPDGRKQFFPESMSDFGDPFDGWVDLGPSMGLKLEKAYFVPPDSRKLSDYRGLETAQYQYVAPGLVRMVDYLPLVDRPDGQAAVTSALPLDQLLRSRHRFFFQVVLSKEFGVARAVLLSGDSGPSLAGAAARLSRGEGCPDSRQGNVYCTVIPETISASLQFEIEANGRPRLVLWGSTVASVVDGKRPVRLLRSFRGKMVPVTLDPQDPRALRLPLWPGDVLKFGSRLP